MLFFNGWLHGHTKQPLPFPWCFSSCYAVFASNTTQLQLEKIKESSLLTPYFDWTSIIPLYSNTNWFLYCESKTRSQRRGQKDVSGFSLHPSEALSSIISRICNLDFTVESSDMQVNLVNRDLWRKFCRIQNSVLYTVKEKILRLHRCGLLYLIKSKHISM